MFGFECQVLGCLQGNRLYKNFQRWSSMSLLVPTVREWAKFAVQISKDEVPTPSIVWPYRSFENSQHLSNSTKLKPKDIARSSKQQQKQGYKSCKNPIPICISQDASTEHLLARCYWAVWGRAVSKRVGGDGQSGAKWVLTDQMMNLGLKLTVAVKGVKVIELALTLHHKHNIQLSLSLFSGSQGVCNMVTHTIQWRWTVL